MLKKFLSGTLALALFLSITAGCTVHDVALDTKGLSLHENDGTQSVGHIHSNHYYLTLLWIVPILPPGEPQKVQTIYNDLAVEAQKHGASAVTDLTSSKFSFPFPLFPFVVIHRDTMTANMMQ